ncbi:sensor histidine kinase [Streptomyces armeniacus]|uniref:histidine kinase n=1 Tax=Streptomyces armeniacus TaxID=83291 RepID=A0A345Y1A3_9ACTN|nr:sensor histidine kinase [Streptomyces armeniacus]
MVSSVVLTAVVCAVIGTVTTIALRSYLYGQLDDRVQASAVRSAGLPPHGPEGALDFVAMPGQELGTVGARVSGGSAAGEGGGGGEVLRGAIFTDDTARSAPGERADPLTPAQTAALNDVPRDGRPHTVDLPGLGAYRVDSARTPAGAILVGLPLDSVQDTLGTLVVVELCVAAGGVVAAGVAGAAMVRIALRPLRRVAATATRVSELRLDRGEVVLHERVPASDTDPGTEVGQVGGALNRLLGHVGSALTARHASEVQVRQFVADASHELRTPLASIRGYAELTRRGREPTGPDTRHALGRIEAEAARMTGLVEDLLLLARLDAGRPLSRQDTDLSPLVVDAVSDARAAARDHAWHLELPDEPATVTGDTARLHQVLVNLLGNAAAHTPPGTTVTARVRRRGAHVLLEVADDGPGIPAALLPHVFERFARGDAARTRAGDAVRPTAGDAAPSTAEAPASTGLGLAIVAAVVTAHRGEVTVRSAPGDTVFAVRLPAARPPSAAPSAPLPPSPRLTGGSRLTGGA